MNSYTDRKISIALLDDHYIVLHGLKDLLARQDRFAITGAWTTSQQLLTELRRQPVDVVILDYQLAPADIDGLNLIKMIHRLYPRTAILMVSALYNPATVAQAMRAGARGFIGKNRPETEFEKAVLQVHEGGVFIEPDMAELMAAQQFHGKHLLSGRLNDENVSKSVTLAMLSPKEQEVIRCFLTGMTVTEIAVKFNRSKKTVSGQKSSAMRKLGIKADHELYIIQHELLTSTDPGAP